MSRPRTIGPAMTQDLPQLQDIERAGDAMFEPLFGPLPFGPDAATTGHDRASEPGFLLVLRVPAEQEGAAEQVIGFVHVLEVPEAADAGAQAHLEQLAVLPGHLRRGHGRALVEAAAEEAAHRGYRSLTLRTYAEVPWNRPFYEACGFSVIDEAGTGFRRGLVETERALGLLRHGERVLMERPLPG